MRKILSVIVALTMLVCLLPSVAFPATALTENGYSYTISNGEATITAGPSSGDIIIPSTLGGYPVTKIATKAFSWSSRLTSVTFPDSVTSIGDWAFYQCTGLTGVYISDLTAWCEISFLYSYSNPLFYAKKLYLNGQLVTNLVIPDSVTSIGKDAFYNCTSLTSITIPDSVTSIWGSAFEGCTSLTSITIPDSVTNIGNCAFYNCTGLTNVTIGNGVTSIGEYAFYGCTGLTSITIPDSVTSIGDWAFSDCTVLTSVIIPDSVTSIGDWAFYKCTDLTSVTIPDSVTSIGEYAFYKCTGLTSVTIGNGVTSIGEYAFYGCTGLVEIWYRGDEADRAAMTIGTDNGDLTAAVWHYNTCYVHTYSGDCDAKCNLCGWTRKISVEHTYSSDCDYGCDICGNIREVSVEHAYDHACDTVCNICGYVRIIEHTYSGDCDTDCNVCGNIREVSAEHTYTDNDDYECNVCGAVRWLKYTVTDNAVTITEYTGTATDVVIPATVGGLPVKTIGTYAFSYKNLTSVIISAGVETIAASAFRANGELTSVSIPTTVTTIGDSAFRECTALATAVIPKGVATIGTYAFFSTGLTTVDLAATVTGIGEYAFASCAGLAEVWYRGSEANYATMAIDTGNGYLTAAVWHYNTCYVHTYSGDCDAECNLCDMTREATGVHQFSNACDANCNVCGAMREAGDHRYDNECDTDCNECGAMREVGEHQYTNACDLDCNICTALRLVQDHIWEESGVCSLCGINRLVITNAVVQPVKPVTGQAYKVVFVQENLNDTAYFLTGGLDGYYLQTTSVEAEGADFYVEETSGGYYVYTYIHGDVYYVAANRSADGHSSLVYSTTQKALVTYSDVHKTMVYTTDGVEYALFGTFGTHTKGALVQLVGTSFFGYFVLEGSTASAPEETEGPDATVTFKEDTAYKLFMNQLNVGEIYYALNTSQSDKFIETTLNVSESADFYLEKCEGGYKIYTFIGSKKMYLDASTVTTDGRISKFLSFKEATYAVFTYDESIGTWFATVGGAKYGIGTYSAFTTISMSDASYFTAASVGKTQYVLQFVESAKVPTEDKGGEDEDGETGDVTPSLTAETTVEPAIKTTTAIEGDEGSEDDSPAYTTPEEIVNAAYGLASGEALEGTYTLTGVIISSKGYNATYGDITVTMVVGNMTDKPIMCYCMAGADVDTIKVGDTITVTGTLKNYNGTIEFDKKCSLDSYFPGTTPDEGGDEGGDTTEGTTSEMDIFAATGTLAADSNSISWTGDGFTFVNNKDISTTAIRVTDTDHFRVYRYNVSTIASTNGKKITKIVITAVYATGVNSAASLAACTFSGGTVSVSDKIVTITFDTPVDALEIVATAQWRLNHIAVTFEGGAAGGDNGGEAPHVYDNACDTDCNECGYVREAPHVYDNACDTDCNECGITRITEHVYTNSCDTDCNVCGEIREITHNYTSDCDTNCNVCKAVREVTVDHTFDHTCDTDCNACGMTRTITHQYDNACDAQCNVCGTTRTPAPHWYSSWYDLSCDSCGKAREICNHVYMNACDLDCNLCGVLRFTSHTYDHACDTVCNVCGALREVGDHRYDNECDTDCNECGTVREVGEHVYATEYHSACTYCGALRTVDILTGLSDIYKYQIHGSPDGGVVTIVGIIGNPTELVFPATIEGYPVVELGYIFDYTSSLRSVVIPATVTKIATWTFRNCRYLEEITVDPNNPVYHSANNCLIETANKLLLAGTTQSVIPADGSVTAIGHAAFYYRYALTEMIIPEGVTSIGNDAFYGCYNLRRVDMPTTVTTIGSCAFEASGITFIAIPDGITRIESGAFCRCDSLKAVYLGAGVQTIECFAFDECDLLMDVWYGGTLSDRKAIVFLFEGGEVDPLDGGLSYVNWHYSCCGWDSHTFDSLCDMDCNICGLVREVYADHVYDHACDTDCNNCGLPRETTHRYTDVCDTDCNLCGYVREAVHSYASVCDTDCDLCGYIREAVHAYVSVCDTDCDLCGYIREAVHSYASVCDTECDLCGHIREAEAEHQMISTVVWPTAEAAGYTEHVCGECGHSYRDSETAWVLGDVNADGTVDMIDGMFLARYLAAWDGYDESTVNLAAADVNGDDTVDLLDGMVLQRHLAEWAGYEHLPVAI